MRSARAPAPDRVLRPAAGGGRPGPTSRLVHAMNVIAVLAASDMRARYGRGRWQLIKWLVDPFAAVGIYLVLVVFVLDRGGEAPGLSLACAVVPFQLVIMSVTNAISSVQTRSSILLNMGFDRTLMPISSVATEAVATAASSGLIVLMMAAYRVPPTTAVAWLPLVIAVTALLSASLAYAASLVGVWFPDLRIFAVSLFRTLYFVAPGLVPLSEVDGRAADLLRINPLTGLFEATRATLLYGHRPAAWTLLVPLGIATALLLLVLPVFRREQRHFAKVVQ